MLILPARFCVLIGLCLSLICDGAGAQKTPSAPPTTNLKPNAQIMPANLDADKRLDRCVSLHEVGIPLRTLLLNVSQEGLALTADHNCDALELHLNLRDRPLRHLMNSLAQLVPGQWYPKENSKGYLLVMNGRAVAWRQRWWDLYLEERQRVLREIPAMALKAMQAKPEVKAELSAADGNVEGLRQYLLAGPTFFHQLPFLLQNQIANSLNEISVFSGVRGTGMNEGAIVVPLTELPAEAQQRLIQTQGQAQRSKPEDSYALFKNDGGGITANIVNAEGRNIGAGLGMDIPLNTNAPMLPLNHSELLRQVRQMQKLHQEVPTTWKEFAAYQESRFWPDALPPKGYIAHQDQISDLEKMAQEDRLEFVSDYYSSSISYSSGPEPKLSPQAQEELHRLDTRLNILSAENDVSWKATPEQIYLLRKNRWYRDDRLEVPAPLLERWLEHDMRPLAKAPDPAVMEGEMLRRYLDWQAEVVSKLTPWQIFYGLRWATVPPDKRKEYVTELELSEVRPEEATQRYFPFQRFVTFGFSARYHLLLFYASLNSEQRTALLEGRLHSTELSGEQKKMAAYAQPLLGGWERQGQPVMLTLRHPPGSYSVGDVNVRLVVTAQR